MLTAARRHYQQQQRITALGAQNMRRLSGRGPRAVATGLVAYQLASISLAEEQVIAALEEQGIPPLALGSLVARSLTTPVPETMSRLSKVATDAAFDLLTRSLIQDAGHTAASVGTVIRPAATGHVRSLNPPSCSRCAILAGRVYRYSQGFQRHPGCDCVMTPTNDAAGADLVTDPMEAFRKGQIRGLSKAETEAVNDGADIGKVVNVRRKAAGITLGSSVVERAGRPTPFGIYSVAASRTEAIDLLRRFGYIT